MIVNHGKKLLKDSICMEEKCMYIRQKYSEPSFLSVSENIRYSSIPVRALRLSASDRENRPPGVICGPEFHRAISGAQFSALLFYTVHENLQIYHFPPT